MTWPSSDVSNSNTSSATTNGQPAAFRLDASDLITKFNQLRNHVTSFMQTLLNRATAALARVDLELGTYYFHMQVSSGRTTSGEFSGFTDTSGQNNGGGNSASAGTYTAPVTGLYQINFACKCSGTFSGSVGNKQVLCYFRVNSTGIGFGQSVGYTVASQDADAYISSSGVYKLTAGDVLTVHADTNVSGVTVDCEHFAGAFIG